MKNFRFYIILTFIGLNVFVTYIVLAENRHGELTVAFLDVGQGDAIFIEAPNGNQILIDGGKNKKILRELSKVMPFYDRSIDMIIVTHPDQDHIGGIPAVLESYDVEYLMESGNVSDNTVYHELNKQIEEKNIKKLIAERRMTISLSKDVYLQILFPDRDVEKGNSNTASIIAKLVYKEKSFLFTGDSPKKIERYLAILDDKNLDIDVLAVGHHGSKTSTSDIFLQKTSPKYAVISAGKDNSYGHPHEEVLDSLTKMEVEILRTDREGRVIFKTDGLSISSITTEFTH